tara:strand:+ start:1151 stop:1828 length:678 start_codon:yes stop_codon:yes gene_type:complete
MPKSLQIDKAVDGNLKPIKDSDGSLTALEISSTNIRTKDLEVSGDLNVSGTIKGFEYSNIPGQIIGYTRLQGDLTNQNSFEIQNSLTVEDDTHLISFRTPPSAYVEIEATFFIDVGSTDTNLDIALSSTNATDGYTSVSAEFEYDSGSYFSDDELDDSLLTVKWVLGQRDLDVVGGSNFFWIAFGTSGVTKTCYLRYGLRATHGAAYPPFTIKATALPDNIYDGQ